MATSKKQSAPFGVKGVYRKKNTFYYRGQQVNGYRPRAVCLHTNDLTQAILQAEKLRIEHEVAISQMGGDGGGVGKSRNLGHCRMSEMIAIYLREKNRAGDFRPATLAGTTQMLEQSCRVMGDPYLGHLGKKELQEYSLWLRDVKENPGMRGVGLSEATIHTYLNRLRCFFSWAVQTNRMAISPMQQMKIGRVRVTKIHDFCEMDEREILLKGKCHSDVRTILFLGFFAGLRYMEMLALRWCDVKDEAGKDAVEGDRMSLLIRAHDWFVPKGKSARVVPAPARLRDYLRGLKPGKIAWDSVEYVIAPEKEWRPAAANGYRFNPKKSFKSLVKSCGIKRSVSYHTLRHSYITHHLNAGTSMSLLCLWTGDDEETLRSHYAGYSPDPVRVEAIC